MRVVLKRWPRVYQFLKFGTSNINTQERWDAAWTRHRQGGTRGSGALIELRERICGLVPSGSTVLDVGCGVGETLDLLRSKRECTCSGVDIAPSAVSAVVEKGMDARVTKLPSIPYADEVFDVVVCTETLEHVNDASATLDSIRRVLKPGGMLLLSVPDGSIDEEEGHVHRFSEDGLTKALNRNLRLERIERLTFPNEGCCPSFLAIARRPTTVLSPS